MSDHHKDLTGKPTECVQISQVPLSPYYSVVTSRFFIRLLFMRLYFGLPEIGVSINKERKG